LDHLMSRVACGEVRLVRTMLAQAAPEHLDALRGELEHQLRTLPVPLHRSHPLTQERSSLLALRDTIDACLGLPEALLREARERWLAGGSHVEYLRLLVRNGHSARAVSMAIALLDANEQRDRQELETLLAEVSLAPTGWARAVTRFAQDPSELGWRRLQRSTPCEVYQERVRYTLRILMQLGVSSDVVFHFATLDGATPEAIGLAEEGLVAARVVEQRSLRSDHEGRVLWLGLAARAACVAGDQLGTIRLLRAAYAAARGSTYDPARDLAFVQDHADACLRALLLNAGFPAR
jgi:hypothetical protein